MSYDQDLIQYQIYVSKSIGWYIDFVKKSGKREYTQKEVAKLLNFTESSLSRKIIKPDEAVSIVDKESLNKFNKRTLKIDEAKEICEVLGTSLINVLFFYQHKDFYEENLSIFDNFQKLTNKLTSLDISLDSNIEAIQKEIDEKTLESKKIQINGMDETINLITDISNPDFTPWLGKHYCYFSSTSSNEAGKKREIVFDKDNDDPKIKELLDVTPSDYIFCGILEVFEKGIFEDDYCHVNFSFLSDPNRKIKKEYKGILTISKIRNAVFCELIGDEEGEKSYFIVEKKEVGSNTSTYANYSIAMVLTLSSKEGHRRPCCERMIISKNIIPENTEGYKTLKANLFMNDHTIRITQWGYNELIKEIKQSNDLTLKKILEEFPDIRSFDKKVVPVEECAFIPEAYIDKLNVLAPEAKRKFELMLRLHSIASWYYKTKSTKVNDLIQLVNS